MHRGRSSVAVLVCSDAYNQRNEKAHSFGGITRRCRRVVAVGDMLGAACTKAHSLLCVLYLHMTVYTLIE